MSGRFFLWVVFSVVLQLFSGGTYGDESCDIDVENTLKTLLSPDQNPTIQVRALRRDFLRKIKHLLEEPEATPDIANSNINDYGDTRNIEDLYRHGLIRTLHDEEQKRSIANLAKNGQLPMWQVKRGLESLARNGDLHREKELQRLINQFYEKRNLENIMKKLNSPYNTNTNAFYYDESPEKRNVASVARDGGHFGKRNVAALLRQSKYHTNPTGENSNESRVEDSNNEPENMKRSLASIKAQYEPKNIAKRSVPVEEHKSRIKRQDYEYMDPAVYQNQNDYQELVNELNEAYQFPEKRFLGSVARQGWYRSPTRYSFKNREEKRHIGSLARLGWLPTIRNIRRFNRSGRTSLNNYTNYVNRKTTPNGQNQDYTSPENLISLEKKFLLQSAVDNILLRKLLSPKKPIVN